MRVAGIVREMTAASAKRAALGAGAIVMDVIAANDKRLPHEQIQRISELRPVLERENLGPARDRIHDIFLEHVMAHAPGYDKLIRWADAPIMPTPGAVGDILQMIAKKEGINAVGVDIGGATTDVSCVFGGTFNRTVSANLG